ncbi:MAG: DUF6491 family protein [Pseudomonadota bacterium]
MGAFAGAREGEDMKQTVLGLTAAIGVMGVSTPGFTQNDDAADLRIGEEVNRICFRPNISGWRTIDDLDDVILLQQGVNDWYYVELLGPCPNRVLRSAIQIGIESAPGPSCITRGDVIIVRDTPGLARRCNVRRMYKWDDDAVEPEEASENE